MDKELLQQLLKVRISVGFLGEEAQHGWWQTRFFADWSTAFLAPTFPRAHAVARYHGVREAARRIHDDFIGVGRVFHLFRLPEDVERSLHELATSDTAQISSTVSEKGKVLTLLSGGATPASTIKEGPALFGPVRTVFTSTGLRELSGWYFTAFSEGRKSYPYFSAE